MRKYSITAMDLASTTKFVRIMAGKAGLKPVFHPFGSMQAPYTNPITKEIHIETPLWSFTEVEHMLWLGKALHETGHHRGDNYEIMDFSVKKKIDMKSLLGTIMNLLSDWINDQQWEGELDGAHKAVVMIQIECARKGLEHVTSAPIPDDDKTRLLLKLFAWIYDRRAATFQPALMAAALDWAKVIDFDSLVQFNDELNAIHDGQSCYDLAIKILNSEGLSSEQPEPGEEGQPGEGEEGEDGETETDGDGEGDGEDEGEGDAESDKEGEKSDKESKGKKGKEVFVSYRDILLADDHGKSPKDKGKPVKIVYDHEWEASYVPKVQYDEIDLSRVVK